MSSAGTPPNGDNGRIGSGRRRTLRRSLTRTFVGVSLVSVLLLGALQFVQARGLLTDAVTDQLRDQQASTARAIRGGLERLEQTVVLAARSQEVVGALGDLSAGYQDLLAESDLLDTGQSAAVDEHYASVVAEIAAAGLPPPSVDQVSPQTEAGRYLHYHYIVRNQFEERRRLTSADQDDSDYGRAHAQYHPRLAELATQLGYGDLLLVDGDGNVVYSTDKRLDYGTNAQSGPWSDSALGDAVTTRLAAAAVGDAVLNDIAIYLPGGGRPVLLAAAAVRDEARTVGALVVQIPIEALDVITSGGGTYPGLGDSGEIYVVGRDRLMRSDSRLRLEDPDRYLEVAGDAGLEAEAATAITTFDTTVMLQPVDTTAVDRAFDDQLFVGRTSNYLDRGTLTVAGPVGSDQVDWVVVADLGAGEAGSPLRQYAVRIGIIAALLIPLVALVAVVLADRMTRPAAPLVATTAQVAAGDLQAAAPDLGSNEYGDAARRLNTFTADLRAQERALRDEEQEIRELLLSALPARLVEKLRSGQTALEDVVDTATVVAVTVSGVFDTTSADPEAAVEVAARVSRALEELADQLGAERVHSASDLHVFVAGLDAPDPDVETAARFALGAADAIERIAEELDTTVDYHAGISAGDVVSGVLDVDQLTYGLFGDPSRTALMLNAVAGPGQILVDDDTADLLGDDWLLETASGLIDLQGDPVSAHVLGPSPIGGGRPVAG